MKLPVLAILNFFVTTQAEGNSQREQTIMQPHLLVGYLLVAEACQRKSMMGAA